MSQDRANAAPYESPTPRLLAVTGLLAAAGALVAWASPHARALAPFARPIAEIWAIAALLLTAHVAPSRGQRRLPWLLGLAAVYAGLVLLDLTQLSPLLLGVITLAVLTTGALVGAYIGGLLEYPGMLMVVAYVAAFADVFSVLHPNGLTAAVLKNPTALALLTVPFPVLGTDGVASLVGIGDVTFVALFVTGARATGLSARRTEVALALAMALVALTVEVLGVALPALPFLSAAIVIAHPEVRRLPPDQTRRIVANLAVVTAVLGGLLLSAVLRG